MDVWEQVRNLVSKLDDTVPAELSPDEIKMLRELKISEEDIATVTGAPGDPRAGRSPAWRQVEEELADVVLSAMVALHRLTGDGEAAFAKRLQGLMARAGLDGAPAS